MGNQPLHKTLSIAKYTLIGNIRNRIFLVLILFGLVILAASVLLSLLSQEQEIRMLTDVGLAAIEILSLFTAVFLMVNIILEEMESRTIYLILTRAIGKNEYLLGRFLGTIISVLLCMVVMTMVHVVLLYWKGWQFEKDGFLYLLSVLMSLEKIFLISAIALFFSLFSSSGVVSWIFTFFIWTLGHFAMELKFLSGEIKSESLKMLFKGIYLLIPNFQYLNARDLWIIVSDKIGMFVMRGTLYTLVYSTFCFLIAAYIFRKKEF